MTQIKKNIIDYQTLSEKSMLFQLSWPVVVSLLIQGLYSFVDGIFLARLGAEVLSAISLSFVVQNLSASFFTGIATGMNAVISRGLGADDYYRSRSAVKSGFMIQGVFMMCFVAFGVFGVKAYFKITTSNQAVINYGMQYLTPIMLMNCAMVVQVTAERLLQASGMTRYMLYAQVAGTIVNITLDPIMIFGFGPIAPMGITGAAYATIIGQMVAACISLYFNFRKNTLIFTNLNKGRFDWEVAKTVMRIGIPTAATGISASFGNYFINKILIGFSVNANAAFGIYAKLQSIALMPTQGLSAGLVTMYAFFYGKMDIKRINKTIKVGEIMVQVWNTFCFLLFFSIPAILMQPFSPSPEMIAVGIPCFRIIGITYLTSGLMAGLTAFFQATGHSHYTFFVSLSRTVFVRVPVAYWLASYDRVEILWWCWPISEVTSDTVCLILFIYCYRQFRRLIAKEKGKMINSKNLLY